MGIIAKFHFFQKNNLKFAAAKKKQVLLRETYRIYLRYSVNFRMNIMQEKVYLLKPHL